MLKNDVQLGVTYKNIRCSLVVVTLLLISACVTDSLVTIDEQEQSVQPLTITEYPEFGAKPDLVSTEQLFQLNEKQEQKFILYLKEKRSLGIPRHQIVTNFLEQFISGFNFHSETLIASESMTRQRGNCLTLAILTTAFAKLAEVEVGYQLMEMRPVYLQKGKTIFTSQHVRSILYDPDFIKKEGFILVMKPLVIIDYFPGNNASSIRSMVDENEFISMYYRNTAADAISQADYNRAFWLAREALEFSPRNQQAINMLAIVFDKMNHTQDAEDLYRFGISQTDVDVELLSNYEGFLSKNDRHSEALEIQKLIENVDQPNPFDWLNIADKELGEGHLMSALKYYNKVVALAPYLHHGYAGQAKVAFLLGNTNRARLAFIKASELSVDEESSLLLKAKMGALDEYRWGVDD